MAESGEISSLSEILNDPKRLELLAATALLDSPPEEAFDRLTRLASTILDAPVALVSLVDNKRQFFKSQVGLPDPLAAQRGTPLSRSFCQHVVASATPLIVADARQQPRRKISAGAGVVTGFLARLRRMGLFLFGVGLRVL